MKKYEYVHLHISKLIGAKSEEHRQIIDEYAKKGYRYVGYIPTNIADCGKIKEMDLIFEKDWLPEDNNMRLEKGETEKCIY